MRLLAPLLLMACTHSTLPSDNTPVDTATPLDTEPPTDTGVPSDPVIDIACDATTPVGWTEASHTKVDADYDVLMGDGDVPRLDIIICPADYAAMQADLAALTGGGGPGGGGGGPGGGPGGGGDTFPDADPIYVPVLLVYEGQTWPRVGMRYKGNSSLYGAAQSGIAKLPFRLDLDRYEDDFPALEDQRFYGFKDLKFSSAYNDASRQRDVLASDTFRAAGVPAAKGGFVRVHVDVGNGPVYWGLYSAFEDPANALLDDWFGSDEGNAYKPDGDGAALRSFVQADFEKKTNDVEADFSDVTSFISALNADRADGAVWRANLEATFDVPGYLRYLALNNLIGNWDAYGAMTHNYYLYADPANDGRLTWIPWDFNESYASGQGNRRAVSVAMNEVSSAWPLIRHLADDPVYQVAYEEEIDDLMATVFSEAAQSERILGQAARIRQWADAESGAYVAGDGDVDQAASALITRVRSGLAEGSAY